jgi:hypothetical protein
MTETAAAAPAKIDLTDMLESINGYEEIGLETEFNVSMLDMVDLVNGDQADLTGANLKEFLRMMRGLVFVLEKRKGATTKDAKHTALLCGMRDLMDKFDIEPDEDDADPADPMAGIEAGDAPGEGVAQL